MNDITSYWVCHDGIANSYGLDRNKPLSIFVQRNLTKGLFSKILRIKKRLIQGNSASPKLEIEVKWLLLFNGNSRPDHRT